MKKKKLARKQLETTLQKARPFLEFSIPSKGWIRAIRNALGMSARQLAYRLGVVQQRITVIEREEATGSLTLKTMRRVAECLDCVFVYALVPRTSLEEFVRNQATSVAQKRLSRASHTMKLESQELSQQEQKNALADLIEELVDTTPPTLWNEQ